MTDFVALLQDKALVERLRISERLRSSVSSDDRIDKALDLAHLVGVLRQRARRCHSEANRAGSDKHERIGWKKQAAEAEFEAQHCSDRLRTIDEEIGALIDLDKAPLEIAAFPSQSLQALFVDIYASRFNLARYQYTGINPTSTIAQDAPIIDELDQNAVLDQFPLWHRLYRSSQLCLDQRRFIFDPTKMRPDDIVASLLLDVQQGCHYLLKDSRVVICAVPASKLVHSAQYGWCLCSPRSATPVGFVFFEGDYPMRRQGVRIDKRVRGKLAQHPFPSSFLIQLFMPSSQPLPNQLRRFLFKSQPSREAFHFMDVLRAGQLNAFVESAETTLEQSSFLLGHVSNDVDYSCYEHLKGLDAPWKHQYPAVQYPQLHRWFRCLQAQDPA